MWKAQEEGTLVLLENLDLLYTSEEIEVFVVGQSLKQLLCVFLKTLDTVSSFMLLFFPLGY